ncbi:Lipoyl synthase [hydrothermal vent metagenome]|uniref:lipoyl synthase n=1 Tax=hydrothermal vent metagenome TaxID=652676 RepID=A0A3B1AZH7_9ZZZZ
MSESKPRNAPSRTTPESHQRGAAKLAPNPFKVEPSSRQLRKPSWIRVKAPSGPEVTRIKRILRDRKLSSVCEEAACPNLGECFHNGTATFMIMGDICTRRCPFCDVAHGKPKGLDESEPQQLAEAVRLMGLKYVVITSVNRDDLRDGGGTHFAQCIHSLRQPSSEVCIEILVPDFRGRQEEALAALEQVSPDVFNHNLETIPRLYQKIRPGADYSVSLELLQRYKEMCPVVPTKSGLMLGLGETLEEVEQVMLDLRNHGCNMLTLGQYLQPSLAHLRVERYVTPEEFDILGKLAEKMGFSNVASAPLVRSSYHADRFFHYPETP